MNLTPRAIFLAGLIASLACARTPAAAPAAAGGTPSPASAAAGPSVIFPDGFAVRVEIANDAELRAQGLMHRDQLRPGTGMLFLFTEDGEYPFWMKNTMIALDMIWIDAQKKIVHVEHDVPPCQVADCPSYAPHALSRYVLEVPGGVAGEHGLRDGDVLRFQATEGIAAH